MNLDNQTWYQSQVPIFALPLYVKLSYGPLDNILKSSRSRCSFMGVKGVLVVPRIKFLKNCIYELKQTSLLELAFGVELGPSPNILTDVWLTVSLLLSYTESLAAKWKLELEYNYLASVENSMPLLLCIPKILILSILE